MEKIALWCAGQMGKHLLSEFKKIKEARIDFVVDSNADSVNDWENAVPLVRPDQVHAMEPVHGVIIATKNREIIQDVIQAMIESGVARAGICKNHVNLQSAVAWDDIVWIDIKDKAVLPYLEVNIEDRCNLNCAGCSHFSNLFTKEDKTELSVESFERDLKKLSTHIYVQKLRLLGGEPFLNKNLERYMEISRCYFPGTDIRIATNGTLLLRSSREIFECLRENDIAIDFTQYPPINKYKEEIVSKLRQEEICYGISEEVTQFLKVLHENRENIPEICYNACKMNHCKFLRNGKIYTCPLEGLFYKFTEYYQLSGFEFDSESAGIDIYDDNLDWKNINELINRPIELCGYCDKNGGEPFEWHVSAHPQKEEWLI